MLQNFTSPYFPSIHSSPHTATTAHSTHHTLSPSLHHRSSSLPKCSICICRQGKGNKKSLALISGSAVGMVVGGGNSSLHFSPHYYNTDTSPSLNNMVVDGEVYSREVQVLLSQKQRQNKNKNQKLSFLSPKKKRKGSTHTFTVF